MFDENFFFFKMSFIVNGMFMLNIKYIFIDIYCYMVQNQVLLGYDFILLVVVKVFTEYFGEVSLVFFYGKDFS